ncbi:MAG: orotidine-5'-phosphate decarboxylase, partial [Treponema sp.]|nr:orotidine-5'-phosphate decarboxylase [Treponema sp.]
KAGGLLLERVGDQIAKINQEFKAGYDAYSSQTCGPIGAVVGATQVEDARILRDRYPETFFLIPGYGAQGGAAEIARTLLEKCGGTVNSSRGILCAWKKDEALAEKRERGTLSMSDIADSAARAAIYSKKDLTGK